MHIDDLKFMRMAIDEARKCQGEDGRVHPKVGAVVVLNGEVLATAHRGELADGDHAEFTALDKKLAAVKAAGATVYTTLEPCTVRSPEKTPCADRLIARRVGRVVIGMLDPNPDICGRGFWLLREAGIATDVFPNELMAELEDLNRDFIHHHRPKRRHAVPALSTVAPGDAAEESAKQATPPATTEVSARQDQNDMFVAFNKALSEGDLAQGDALYQQLSQSLKEKEVQAYLDAMYFDLRYRAAADPDDLAKLEALIPDDLAGHDAAMRRGAISLLANDLAGACGYYAKAAELAKVPESRIRAVVSQANILMKIESQGEALRLLLSQLKPDLPPAAAAILLKALSQTFGKCGEPYMSAALLAKAAQLIPADGETRFRAALKLGEVGISHLSLLLYERLSRLNQQDKGVFNNMGIQCLALGMSIKGIEYYRKAAEGGLTLGKTNLAFEYLKAGFMADAKKILEDAQKDPNAPPRTGSVMVAMGDMIKQQGEIWEAAIALANKEQLFLSKCADGLMLTGAQAPFRGQWEMPDGVVVWMEGRCNVLTGEWGEEHERKRVSITAFGAAGILSYEDLGLFVYGANRRKDGLVYLENEGTVLQLFYIADEKPVFETWKRKHEPLLLKSAPRVDGTPTRG
jgi:pyrimidine deaminase RibD-like protein